VKLNEEAGLLVARRCQGFVLRCFYPWETNQQRETSVAFLRVPCK